MAEPLHYAEVEGVAEIVLDDGKVNAMSLDMIAALEGALERAARAELIVQLSAVGQTFSGGFDLHTLKRRNGSTLAMIRRGFLLSARMLAYPRPILLLCEGHALAMGAFLLNSADYRLGLDGEYQIAANEVEIGLTMPRAALELCAHRLNPASLHAAMLLSERYGPRAAVEAGFLDAVVPREQLEEARRGQLERARGLHPRAFRETKRRAHGTIVRRMRRAVWRDQLEFAGMGVKQMLGMR